MCYASPCRHALKVAEKDRKIQLLEQDALILIEHLRKAESRVDRLESELIAEREQKERYKGMMTQQYAVIDQLRDALVDQQNAVAGIFQESTKEAEQFQAKYSKMEPLGRPSDKRRVNSYHPVDGGPAGGGDSFMGIAPTRPTGDSEASPKSGETSEDETSKSEPEPARTDPSDRSLSPKPKMVLYKPKAGPSTPPKSPSTAQLVRPVQPSMPTPQSETPAQPVRPMQPGMQTTPQSETPAQPVRPVQPFMQPTPQSETPAKSVIPMQPSMQLAPQSETPATPVVALAKAKQGVVALNAPAAQATSQAASSSDTPVQVPKPATPRFSFGAVPITKKKGKKRKD